jgi:hypothetical protein
MHVHPCIHLSSEKALYTPLESYTHLHSSGLPYMRVFSKRALHVPTECILPTDLYSGPSNAGQQTNKNRHILLPLTQNSIYLVTWLMAYSACLPAACWFLAQLILDPDDGSDTFLWNVSSHTDYTALYPSRMQHSSLPLWEPQILDTHKCQVPHRHHTINCQRSEECFIQHLWVPLYTQTHTHTHTRVCAQNCTGLLKNSLVIVLDRPNCCVV